MKKKILLASLFAAGMLMSDSLKAQDTEGDNLYDLSLEELMNVSIVSASQKEERLFDAPLASFVIAREDIRKAGISSIPEALRLCPEVIVRETTNGNYEIHLRGFDNLAQHTTTAAQANTLTLVMIDNRPVFNYNMGGTFWEALPVDIVDVERIEVVRGPAAPLFGPNAVTGVINIITRNAALKGSFVSAQLNQQPDFGGTSLGVRFGEQLNDKLAVGLSGNYQKKQRLDDLNYTYFPAAIPPAYVSSEGYHDPAIEVDPELALNKMGVNAYVDFSPADEQQWRLSGGYNNSETQRVFFSSISPLTFSTNESYYANLSGSIRDIGLRMSYTGGTDNLHLTSGAYSTQYDYKVLDADVNYLLKVSDKLNFRPQLSYQHTEYTDEAYSSLAARGLMGGSAYAMNLVAGSLKGEFYPVKDLRLIASGRFDKFDVSDKAYLSYQFAGTYALADDKLLFRASHARSFSGIFYNYRHIDAVIPSFVTFPNQTLEEGFYVIKGNESEVLTSNTATEFGIRYQPEPALQLDLGYFQQRLKNPITYAFTGQVGELPVAPGVTLPSEHYQYQTLPLEAVQQGITLSANYVPSAQLQLRPFITWQRTETENFDYHNLVNIPGAYNGRKVAHESTPEWYGGALVSYSPVPVLSLNMSTYYYSEHRQYHFQDLTFAEVPGAQPIEEAQIASKAIVNLNVSYNVWDKMRIAVGAKNLLDDDSREFYGTDRNGRVLFTSLNYNF